MDFFKSETHSSVENENAWDNDFNGPVFFSHNAPTSCGDLIAYHGKKFLSSMNRRHIKLKEF